MENTPSKKEYSLGESHYKHANSACEKSGVTVMQQRLDRMHAKNIRRAQNGLPPKLNYAEI